MGSYPILTQVCHYEHELPIYRKLLAQWFMVIKNYDEFKELKENILSDMLPPFATEFLMGHSVYYYIFRSYSTF